MGYCCCCCCFLDGDVVAVGDGLRLERVTFNQRRPFRLRLRLSPLSDNPSASHRQRKPQESLKNRLRIVKCL